MVNMTLVAYADKIDEVEQFFRKNPVKGVERGVQQMLESMRVTSAYATRIQGTEMAQEAFWQSL